MPPGEILIQIRALDNVRLYWQYRKLAAARVYNFYTLKSICLSELDLQLTPATVQGGSKSYSCYSRHLPSPTPAIRA